MIIKGKDTGNGSQTIEEIIVQPLDIIMIKTDPENADGFEYVAVFKDHDKYNLYVSDVLFNFGIDRETVDYILSTTPEQRKMLKDLTRLAGLKAEVKKLEAEMIIQEL